MPVPRRGLDSVSQSQPICVVEKPRDTRHRPKLFVPRWSGIGYKHYGNSHSRISSEMIPNMGSIPYLILTALLS